MSLQSRRRKCEALHRKYYADVPPRDTHLDDAILENLKPDHRVLDAGCGDDLPLLTRYAPLSSFVVGIDVVPPSVAKPVNTEVLRGDLAQLPFQDQSFDLIVSRSVVEHLERPAAVFAEFQRVLRPGGRVVFTTPNRFYYSSLIAAAVPYSWKHRFMRAVFGKDVYDDFPVFYRANTRSAMTRLARSVGLVVVRQKALRHFPFYFMFSPTLFRLGMLYDWLVTRWSLDALQSTWLVVLERM
jgi:SAM-dependent methyltransferase